MQKSRRIGVAGVALLAIACSGGDSGKTPEPPADPATAAIASVTALASMQPLTLSEADVEHFVAALEDFHRLGLAHQSRVGSDPSDATALTEGLRGNAEAMAILRKHEYDLARFQHTAFTVGLAMAADEMDKNQPRMDSAIAEVEKMKGQLPKEQYEMMLAAAKGASAMQQSFQQQPQGNIEIVRRFRERIDRIGK